MNNLEEKLKHIKTTKRIGLMTHVVIGYPTLDDTVQLVKIMSKYADIIELQIPFSDPLADGPTIMKACEESLKNGTKVSDAFRAMKELTEYFVSHSREGENQKKTGSPIGVGDDRNNPALLFMAYYNTVFTYGTEKFIKDAVTAGAVGLIVPDMPIEEEPEEHFYALCRKYNIHAIHVVSPASTNERLQKNASLATGFVYATARQGTTGVKDSRFMIQDLRMFIERVKDQFNIPIAVGFGISNKEQVQSLVGHADIGVVGSALIDVMNQSNDQKMLENVQKFLGGMTEEI